ncbi:MAG: chemotaxis response regulator protein-glutamate methylesterase [Acidobacteriia bacterium]|nr:chemotaxis response regulator protein-glutamate methylesterase [Terriglobia bacterium]
MAAWRCRKECWRCPSGCARRASRRIPAEETDLTPERKTRVLIVDDSAIVRKLLAESLNGEPDLEVVGTAPDPYVARDKILSLHPDVLTLDIEMPRMDGLTFLKKLMRFHPMPVVVISSLAQASSRAALEALQAGAVEVLAKPGGPYSVGEMKQDLPHKIRAAAQARLARTSVLPDAAPRPSAPAVFQAASRSTIIAIGASTGGTEAIRQVLMEMPENSPGIVLVQHIPAVFSTAFANRLNDLCRIQVKEAAHGDRVQAGQALVAPGNFHMTLQKRCGEYRVSIEDGPRVCYQRPSVDVLFNSVAEAAGADAIGAILTGMGSDGAQGMLRMKRAGARTVAQDEASCVVFGMPREAIRLGGVDHVVSLQRVASELCALAAPAVRV